MSTLDDLEVIYLSLEDGEVLRDISDDWGTEDELETGLTFAKLLELREYILGQDFATNLGFRMLLEDIFPKSLRGMLPDDELLVWNSVESHLDFTMVSMVMRYLVLEDYQSLAETLLDEFLLEELSGFETAGDLKVRVRENFEKWQSSERPKTIVESLESLSSGELAKLKSLRE